MKFKIGIRRNVIEGQTAAQIFALPAALALAGDQRTKCFTRPVL